MEDACHNRGALIATVVKVTGTEGHVGRGGGMVMQHEPVPNRE